MNPATGSVTSGIWSVGTVTEMVLDEKTRAWLDKATEFVTRVGGDSKRAFTVQGDMVLVDMPYLWDLFQAAYGRKDSK